jgi:ABC-type multidrug transport system fused ATPase/permease subunit
MSDSFITFFSALVKLAGSCIFMFTISWKLSLLFFGALPLMWAIVFFYGGFLRKFTVKYLEKYPIWFYLFAYSYLLFL